MGLYHTQSDATQVGSDFVNTAKYLNHRLLFIGPEAPPASLPHLTLENSSPAKSGPGVVALSKEQFGLTKEDFSVSNHLSRLEDWLDRSIDAGYSGLSVFGLMDWMHEIDLPVETMAEFELSLHALLVENENLNVLCLYSKNQFCAQTITVQCLGHPYLLSGDAFIANPIFSLANENQKSGELDLEQTKLFFRKIKDLGTAIERLSGKAASAAKFILSEARARLYSSYCDCDDTKRSHRLLQQIDYLTQRIERLDMTEILISE